MDWHFTARVTLSDESFTRVQALVYNRLQGQTAELCIANR